MNKRFLRASMDRDGCGASLLGAIAILIVSASAPPARAQGLSTERLVELCRDPSSDVWRDIGQWLCPAYIRGLVDGARLQAIQVAGVENHRRILAICLPESVSPREAIDAVVAHVRSTPESRRQPAAATVYVALAAAWPCRP